MDNIIDNYIKYQAVTLCQAMFRCINNRFKSVSFTVLENGDVLVRIILNEKTGTEEELVELLGFEFSAAQLEDCVLPFETLVGVSHLPLEHIVFSSRTRDNL